MKHGLQVNCSLFEALGWRRFPEHKCHVLHLACSSRSLLALGDERGRLRQVQTSGLASGNERMRKPNNKGFNFCPPHLSKASHHETIFTKR